MKVIGRVLTRLTASAALLALAAFLVGCSAAPAAPTVAPAPTVVAAADGTVVIGKIGVSPIKSIRKYGPIADHLAANLAEYGIGGGEVKVAPDLKTIAEMISSGEVGFFLDNPYAATKVAELSGGHISVLRIKDGLAEKHGVFFTLTGSGINSLAELNGSVVAFEDPAASAGYAAPISLLVEQGSSPVEVEDPSSSVAPDKVGYVISGDDDNTVQWVLRGKVAAGAVDDTAFAEFNEENPGLLRILAKTQPVMRHQPLVVGPHVSASLGEAIVSVLLSMHESEDGKTALGPSDTERFARPSAGQEASLEDIRQMYELIAKTIE